MNVVFAKTDYYTIYPQLSNLFQNRIHRTYFCCSVTLQKCNFLREIVYDFFKTVTQGILFPKPTTRFLPNTLSTC